MAVEKFAVCGMLMHRASNGWFVACRFNMRDSVVFKNLRHPYQVLNADQSEYKLFRSLRKAIRWCNAQALR
jgi:hypothetical protein